MVQEELRHLRKINAFHLEMGRGDSCSPAADTWGQVEAPSAFAQLLCSCPGTSFLHS